MTLKVIGVGFGRTGTMSLKLALEELGFGPCYHMAETIAHPEHDAMWLALAKDKTRDWRPILKPICRHGRLAWSHDLAGARRR